MSEDSQMPRGLGWGYILYQQVSSVIGGFALITFLGNFIEVDWRGALAELVASWDLYVRPAVKLVFDLLITWPCLRYFKFAIEVPLVLRDYLSVGLVLALSVARANLAFRDSNGRQWWLVEFVKHPFSVMYELGQTVVMWPYQLVRHVRGAISYRHPDGSIRPIEWRVMDLMTISPMIYMGALLLANSLIGL